MLYLWIDGLKEGLIDFCEDHEEFCAIFGTTFCIAIMVLCGFSRIARIVTAVLVIIVVALCLLWFFSYVFGYAKKYVNEYKRDKI